MARPGVTYSEVAEAASHLLGQGKSPTIEHVRHLLGTGSSTTLAKHLRQWKMTHDANPKGISKEHLPDELLALMKGLWERVLGEAEEKIAILEKNHQTRLQELLPELQKYKNNNQRWQQLYGQWQEEKKLLHKEKMAAEVLAQQQQREGAAFAEKQAALMQQLREKQERIQELQRLHQQAQTNLEHFRESVRTQRLVEQQRYDAEKKACLAQNKELLRQQGRMQVEGTKLEKHSQEQLQKTQHFKALYLEEKQKNTAQAKVMLALQTDLGVLTSQGKQVNGQMETLLKQNKCLEQEKWQAMKEKLQLEGQLQQMQHFIKIQA